MELKTTVKLSTDTQIKLLNARLDCIIGLLHLNGELDKCVLAKIGTKEQYKTTVNKYNKNWRSIIKDCGDEFERILGPKTCLAEMTVEEARNLNEAAKRTCEVDS